MAELGRDGFGGMAAAAGAEEAAAAGLASAAAAGLAGAEATATAGVASALPGMSAGAPLEPQRTYALTLGYNGAPFAGFARQPGQLTVQGNVEEALSLLFKQPVLTVCAGRTDAGVHARGQVVSFSVPLVAVRGRNSRMLLRSLNALTHEMITIKSIEERPEGFSARFDAVSREYRYFICVDATPPLFMRDFSWHIPKPLDVDAMRQAACFLEGEHDFKSFCLAASAKGKPTHRYVESVAVEPEQVMGENLLVITVKGNAFLHSMVRTMVGTLVKVGLGHREPEWVQRALAACDRSAAGETAPACGLVFWEVDYQGRRCAYAPAVEKAACSQLGDVPVASQVRAMEEAACDGKNACDDEAVHDGEGAADNESEAGVASSESDEMNGRSSALTAAMKEQGGAL